MEHLGIILVGLSTVLQFLAAVLALRLIRTTGRTLPWLLISSAVILMGIRRSITLTRLWADPSGAPFDPLAEWVALLISTLMVVGIASIAPVFRQAGAFARADELNRRLERELKEHLATMEELKETRERWEIAVHGTSDGLWYWEVGSEDVWYAPRFWELLGYNADSIPPAKLESFNQHLHPDDYTPTWDAVNRHLEQRDAFDVEYRLRHTSGEYRWFRARGATVRSEAGAPIRLAGSIQDISRRKESEERLQLRTRELQRSNEELKQFAYVASHDLQEPLRAVSGFCELLREDYGDQLDAKGKEFINHAVSGAHRMQTLIQALLQYSRVATRAQEFEITDCNHIVNVAIENLQVALEEAQGEVHSNSLPTVMADSTQLMQLFQNLISNAVRFRRAEAPPRITVSAERDGMEWKFEVRDNGIGIDPQHCDRIFAVFQRLNPREEYEGTGIGLAICKRVVERHGGRIWCESQSGAGTSVYFTLPAMASA